MSHRKEKRTRRNDRLFNVGLMTALSVEILCAAPQVHAAAQSSQQAAAVPPARASTRLSLARQIKSSLGAGAAVSRPSMTALPSGQRPILLASAGAVPAAAGAGSGSLAQLQEVVVTGFRQSLENALNEERVAIQPIEAVTPEDLGKMPDQDVAESLQRLPGIQINRALGFGTQVLVEGLSQNVIELNGDDFLTGREFYTTGEASGGGAGGNFQYGSLESVPSEEISGIDVELNPTAADISGAIGGNINLHTQNPLTMPRGLTLAGNARGVDSQGTSGITPNGSLVGAYKFSNRFAVDGSISYDKYNTFDKEFEAYNRTPWVITNSALTPPASGGTSLADYSTIGQSYILPELAYTSNIADKRTDEGATLGMAWRVTDAVTTHVRWFYSGERDTQINYSNKIYFNGAGNTTFPITGINPSDPYSIDGNGVVQSGTFTANGAETATLYQGTSDHANNFQWTTDFDNGGPLTGDLGVFYSKMSSNSQFAQQDTEHGLYETSAGVPTSPGAPGCNNGGAVCASDANASPGYTFGYTNGGTSGLPTVSYPTNVLSNPAWTTFKSAWAWANIGSEELKAVKINLHWRPDRLRATRISAGARYGTDDSSEIFGRYLINGAGYGIQPGCATCGSWLYYQDPGYSTPNIPYSTALSAPGLVETVNNFAAGAMTVKNPYTGGMTNPSTFLNTVWTGAGVPNNTEQFFEDTLSSYSVDYKEIASYLMADVGSPSDHYHINFGVRVVHTSITIDGAQQAPVPSYYGTASWNGVNSNNIPIQTLRGYTDILPSFNYTLDLTDTQQVRLSAARVMAPVNLAQLGVGQAYNFTRSGSGTTFIFAGGSGGNPNLEPYRADQFLLGYFNYFSAGAVAEAQGFYKQVDSFPYTASIATTVGGNTANVTEPQNGKGGDVYGLILAAEYPFRGMLDGFGVDANYTLSKSEMSLNQPLAYSNSMPFPGVSENSLAATLYYQRFGFSGRLSYTYRDKSISDNVEGSTFSIGTKALEVWTAPYSELDAQVGYDFNKHFGIILSATNLTDSATHDYLQWPNLPLSYDNWGRRYFFGVKFRN
jgi:iron complex outermembrane receptor protein